MVVIARLGIPMVGSSHIIDTMRCTQVAELRPSPIIEHEHVQLVRRPVELLQPSER